MSDYPIGHVPNHEYETRRYRSPPARRFLFLSDGVMEARGEIRAFGMDRVKEEGLRAMKADGRLDVEAIVASVRAFLGDAPPQDDMCLLAMSFMPAGAGALMAPLRLEVFTRHGFADGRARRLLPALRREHCHGIREVRIVGRVYRA